MRDRQLNCKRGDTIIFTYVPGSVIDNKCVTLQYCHIFLQEMKEKGKRERKRKKEKEREREK